MRRVYEAWGYNATLPEWAEMFRLEYGTLYKRIARGMDIETALSMRKNQSDKRPKYTYNGETHSAREWADIIGITYNGFLKRLQANEPPEKLFKKGDRRLKYDVKQPLTFPKKDDGYVIMLVSDVLGEKPSVKRVKASEINSVRERYKYSMILRKQP